jgi:hypothetical protein
MAPVGARDGATNAGIYHVPPGVKSFAGEWMKAVLLLLLLRLRAVRARVP